MGEMQEPKSAASSTGRQGWVSLNGTSTVLKKRFCTGTKKAFPFRQKDVIPDWFEDNTKD